MLNFIADIVLSLTVSHATAVTIKILVISLLLVFIFLLVVLFFTAESLINEVEEYPLRNITELGQRCQVRTLSPYNEFYELLHFLHE
jgi:hypothetical protein